MYGRSLAGEADASLAAEVKRLQHAVSRNQLPEKYLVSCSAWFLLRTFSSCQFLLQCCQQLFKYCELFNGKELGS